MNFAYEVITEEIFLEGKVTQLGEIEEYLHKKVANLEAHLKTSTPPDVIEERRKATTEALCAKVVDQVSHTWEALIDDDELGKFAEELHTTET